MADGELKRPLGDPAQGPFFLNLQSAICNLQFASGHSAGRINFIQGGFA
jgi:hypothetical protein